MQIPRIVHQLWKTEQVPARRRDAVESVRRYHKGWDYRLWTDAQIDDYVRTKHPRFYPVFAGMNPHIMRIDVFRDGSCTTSVGSTATSTTSSSGRTSTATPGSCSRSSTTSRTAIPSIRSRTTCSHRCRGHPLWRDVLDSLQQHPPHVPESTDVCLVTGPWYLTGIFYKNQSRYDGVRLTPKPVFSPRRVHGRRGVARTIKSAASPRAATCAAPRRDSCGSSPRPSRSRCPPT
jgi:mannosyltransferase OCH1-like enzyme